MYLAPTNPLPGATTTVFAGSGSQRAVGAILRACIDHTRWRCTANTLHETPLCPYEAAQVFFRSVSVGYRFPTSTPKAARVMTLVPHEYRPQCGATVADSSWRASRWAARW